MRCLREYSDREYKTVKELFLSSPKKSNVCFHIALNPAGVVRHICDMEEKDLAVLPYAVRTYLE